MVARFDDAVKELYQAPLHDFIAERKRLADELKRSGDAADAKRLLTRRRPPISAWVVNQLWWHARDAFDALLSSAEKLRDGDMKATAAHRDAIAKLRARASAILKDAGHPPTESTLRRVTTTLSALAVAGGFDPDPPGALTDDRDPPGFAAFGITGDLEAAPPAHAHAKLPEQHAHHAHDEHARAAKRAAEQEEKRRAEAERKRIAAERHRLEAALRTAKGDLHARDREVKHLEKQLEAAREAVEDAQKIVDGLEAKLDTLDRGN
jgi:hypothetical protein